uniref:Uncharacterized protein n=1 Tax=Glossina pallidipes TaxID=7398 RepID=A0A1A9ZMH3_GLOPL
MTKKFAKFEIISQTIHEDDVVVCLKVKYMDSGYDRIDINAKSPIFVSNRSFVLVFASLFLEFVAILLDAMSTSVISNYIYKMSKRPIFYKTVLFIVARLSPLGKHQNIQHGGSRTDTSIKALFSVLSMAFKSVIVSCDLDDRLGLFNPLFEQIARHAPVLPTRASQTNTT